MQALITTNNPLRLIATKLLSYISPKAFVGWQSPMRLQAIADPQLPAPDWLVAKTRLCGLCGSDYKQVFMNGRIDNPMTSMISWPQVLGHEVVAEVVSTGAKVSTRHVGERVLLNPWLSCVTRSDEQAVLGDPFAVSFHAILKAPPADHGTVLVYGCGTLGLLAIAILRTLYPTVKILAVARYNHQADLARQLGAHLVLPHRPTKQLVHRIAAETGAALNEPWMGLPMLNGGVDAVYDTVSSAETLAIDLRVTRSFGAIVIIGVEPAKTFEWTPLYFKEISIIGSNGFGIETFEGQRKHAMEWYFDFIQDRGLDVTPIITHHYTLRDYRSAFMTCFDQGKSGAVKVLFNSFA